MTVDDLAVARGYTDAYAAFDTDTPRALPAAHLRLQQVNPGGYLGFDSADAGIAGIADFRCDRIASASEMSLTATGREYLMEHQEFVTVEHGAASFQRGRRS